MIKKTQIKFVSIIMSILLGVFGVIFVAMYYITYNQTLSVIEHTIDETATTFYLPSGSGAHSKTIIATLNTASLHFEGAIKNIWLDEDVFTQEEAVKILQTALKKVHKSGKVNNVYYKIFVSEHNSALFVAIDATDALTMFRTNTTRSLFSLTVIYLLLFLLIIKLSWWVLKPLRDSIDKQNQFISNASHELKTPLSIISANTDVLKQEGDSQWLNNIQSQTERMNGLVEDMLSLAKMDEGNIKLSFEKFNISDEIIANALPFDAVAFEKGKTFTVDVLPDVIYNGDRQSVKKIVNILLDNAIKHADEKGEIHLELKRENNKLILFVENTGSNIAKDSANKIFERFYRGDSSRSRESGGSGLGLSIAKSIADANKWKIYAESEPNVKMKITIIL